jgi:hypothetical protein
MWALTKPEKMTSLTEINQATLDQKKRNTGREKWQPPQNCTTLEERQTFIWQGSDRRTAP